MTKRIILGICAGIASGKSSLSVELERKGFYLISTSGILQESGDLPANAQEDIRDAFQRSQNFLPGPSLMQAIQNVVTEDGAYVIDSVRKADQHTALKRLYGDDYVLVFLRTPFNERYRLNKERGRYSEDGTASIQEFRDQLAEDGETEIQTLRSQADLVLPFEDSVADRVRNLEIKLKERIKPNVTAQNDSLKSIDIYKSKQGGES